MKQTAVEFLVDEFKEKLIGHNLPEWVEKIIQQAKAMEKEQRINDIEFGHGIPTNVNINHEAYFKLDK